MWFVEKEQSPVYEEGTFGHLLKQHCNSPLYSSVGFELYNGKDNEGVFYYNYKFSKPFTEIAKVFEKYLNCKIKGVRPIGNRVLKLNSGFGNVYQVLLEI